MTPAFVVVSLLLPFLDDELGGRTPSATAAERAASRRRDGRLHLLMLLIGMSWEARVEKKKNIMKD